MSEAFPLPLKLERTAPRQAVLTKPFVFNSPSLGGITVEEGFDTDYASVPRLFWAIYPPDGAYTEGAVVHDYLYWYQPCTRAEADTVFLEAMEALGIPWLRRRLIYASVRAGGWLAWNDNRKRRLEGVISA